MIKKKDILEFIFFKGFLSSIYAKKKSKNPDLLNEPYVLNRLNVNNTWSMAIPPNQAFCYVHDTGRLVYIIQQFLFCFNKAYDRSGIFTVQSAGTVEYEILLPK